ncbi:putative phenol monooxygenase [Ilyonectria destructans]|nr:putative phenol monooxygenase [Ilyonectria destructans]
MPVFQETAHEDRDLRINPTIQLALPRLTTRPPLSTIDGDEKHEVVVIGAGPAGMMCTLLLARYGLGDSLVCFDDKPGTLKAGQADGLQPRTLEVLKSLDVADEILNHGCHMSEVAFWNPKPKASPHDSSAIERMSFAPDVAVAARYKHEVTIHQGRIERILEDNLNQYAPNCIRRNARFLDFQMDEKGDAEFPVKVVIEQEDTDGVKIRKTARTKYLVGADGAHSTVRRSMGLELVGETTDQIWGVVDFVAETDFPDVRKRCAIHSDAGSVMIIPRERIHSGEYLTRLYVQTVEEVPADGSAPSGSFPREKSRNRRAGISLDAVMEQARRVIKPYKIDIKDSTQVDWWAAYQIGQRMTSKFSLKDSTGHDRVFIAGDACHTHSPKAGQGMNVSMMDSYNLSWKLAHQIHGLSPKSAGSAVLSTYGEERSKIAKMLIDFDTKFSSMFSGKINSDNSVEGLTHEQFLDVFRDGSGFTSGCGIEYPPGTLVQPPISGEDYPVTGDNYLHGTLKPGRRLLDSTVRRYADANLRHLQDDFLSIGRLRVLVFTSFDLLEKDGNSCRSINQICQDVLPSFPPGTVELVVLHPFLDRKFEWVDIPASIKKNSEMRFHGPVNEHLYPTYGIHPDVGAVTVIRPDGYVGVVSSLLGVSQVDDYLSRCLVKIK